MPPVSAIPEVSELSAASQAAASMQALLQRLQQQLAAQINSASAGTPEGKAAIEAIRSRISQVEQRLSASDEISERRQAQLKAGRSEPAASLAAQAGTVVPVRKDEGPGRIIDVFA
jgi:hypothetical protein